MKIYWAVQILTEQYFITPCLTCKNVATVKAAHCTKHFWTSSIWLYGSPLHKIHLSIASEHLETIHCTVLVKSPLTQRSGSSAELNRIVPSLRRVICSFPFQAGKKHFSTCHPALLPFTAGRLVETAQRALWTRSQWALSTPLSFTLCRSKWGKAEMGVPGKL